MGIKIVKNYPFLYKMGPVISHQNARNVILDHCMHTSRPKTRNFNPTNMWGRFKQNMRPFIALNIEIHVFYKKLIERPSAESFLNCRAFKG